MSNIIDRDKSFFGRKHRALFFLLSVLVIVALLVDTSLTRISDIFASNFIPGVNLFIYILISVTFGLGQLLFLRFVGEGIKGVQKTGRPYITLHKVAIGVQCGLTAILALVIIELVTISQYSLLTLMAAITISYSFGAGMMLLLARHFFSWFRMNKDLLMLLYGISAMALSVHLVFSFSFVDYVLSGIAPERTPFSGQSYFATGSLKFVLGNIYNVTSIIAFVSTWSATALLLHNYSRRLGKMRYWIVVTLPLVYFLSQFPAFFLNIFDPLIKADPLFYGTFLILLFSLSKPAGGVLFGIAFWAAARRLPQTAAVRDYLIISAYGFVLLFTADQANVMINATYPPFGLATVSFMGLSSYLILNGIFYSARDSKLRREIKRLALNGSKLLDSISKAQFDQEIGKRASVIAKYHDEIARKIGIQPPIDEKEALDYLHEVIAEKSSTTEKRGSEDKDENKPT